MVRSLMAVVIVLATASLGFSRDLPVAATGLPVAGSPVLLVGDQLVGDCPGGVCLVPSSTRMFSSVRERVVFRGRLFGRFLERRPLRSFFAKVLTPR